MKSPHSPVLITIESLINKPFNSNLYYLIVLWLLSSSAAVYFWFGEGEFITSIDVGLRGLFVSYCVCVIIGGFSGKTEVVLKWMFAVIGIINLAVDKSVYNICHMPFWEDSVALLFGTNLAESGEFLQTYITWQIVVFICLVTLISIVIVSLRRILQIKGRVYPLLLACGVLLIFPLSFQNCIPKGYSYPKWNSIFVCKAQLFLSYKKPVDLRLYRKIPQVAISPLGSPNTVLVIIGESISKSHCSLYGYHLETNHYVQSFRERDTVIVFSKVSSAYYATVPSISMMLSTCESAEDKNYAEMVTIFDVLKASGYCSSWISNQSSSGIVDNGVACFAALADTTIWCGTQGLGVEKKDFDELLIEPVKTQLNMATNNQICFVHTMGCHESFWKRYPGEYAIFEEQEYPDALPFQKNTLAEYDNAILYDDYVVSELFELIKDKEAIAVFVPDHGLDIYDSSPDYFGHARPGDPASLEIAKEIPFLIYCPEKFRNRFPEMFEYLISIKDEPLNTKDFMDLLTCLCGIEQYNW